MELDFDVSSSLRGHFFCPSHSQHLASSVSQRSQVNPTQTNTLQSTSGPNLAQTTQTQPRLATANRTQPNCDRLLDALMAGGFCSSILSTSSRLTLICLASVFCLQSKQQGREDPSLPLLAPESLQNERLPFSPFSGLLSTLLAVF